MNDESNRQIVLAIGVLLLGDSLESGFGLGEIRYRAIVEDEAPDMSATGDRHGQD